MLISLLSSALRVCILCLPFRCTLPLSRAFFSLILSLLPTWVTTGFYTILLFSVPATGCFATPCTRLSFSKQPFIAFKPTIFALGILIPASFRLDSSIVSSLYPDRLHHALSSCYLLSCLPPVSLFPSCILCLPPRRLLFINPGFLSLTYISPTQVYCL